MNITLTGSTGNINQQLIGSLVTKGHKVKVISRSPAKIKSIEAMHATAVIGSIEDLSFVINAFKGADAVYTMIPPSFTSQDIPAYIKRTGEVYAAAVKQAGIPYVVNLSSIGAHDPAGKGPTGANHYVEQRLNELQNANVLHLRPGLFYTNFFGSTEIIKHQNIIGNNFNATVPVAMTHPADIAGVAAAALDTLSFRGQNISYVVSDEKTGQEIATILGEAINKPNLSWVEFPDEVLLHELMKSGMSKQMATVYIIEIGMALRDNRLLEDYYKHKTEALGKTSFSEFANNFAYIYSNN